MSGRGRPRTPDILTPREWEVLHLLREGLSNREIAERLQVSLAGAKFHVSEIISKLGVTTREEAAAWQVRRRWGFSPLALLGGNLPALSTPAKLALSTALLLGLFAAGAVAATAGGQLAPGELLASKPQPTPTPKPCRTTFEGQEVICYPFIKQQLASWAEAGGVVPFAVLEPRYVPPGYKQESLVFSYAEGGPAGDAPRSETLFAKYVAPSGEYLLVNQGYSVGSGFSLEAAPEPYHGVVYMGGREVHWVNGHPIWEERNGAGYPTDKWDESTVGNFTVYWEEPRTGPIAWEIAPDGKATYHRSGEPLGSLIYGPGLPLEELLKVARSLLGD